jgi:ribosomal protein L11 methyltransferase
MASSRPPFGHGTASLSLMSWLALSAAVPAEYADRLSDALLEQGAVSVEISDAAAGTAAEQPVYDEGARTALPGWSETLVHALFAAGADAGRALQAASSAAGLAHPPPHTVVAVADRDWVRATQSQFTAQRISARLWIVPSWRAIADPNAVNVILDPGVAFGTGTHPTTRLCLQWLAAHITPGVSVIDFGCGSGILAVAAMKLGAGSAWGVDIDPQAVLAARQNAMQNQVDAMFFDAAEALQQPARIVVANILANPLVLLAPVLADLTLEGGCLALSGILEQQAEEVIGVYRSWYDFEPVSTEDGWVLLSGVKR